MHTGTRKERLIKENLEKCKERAYRDYKRDNRTGDVPNKEKAKLNKEFTKAAYEADRISKG